MKKILITRAIPKIAFDLLRPHFEVEVYPENRNMPREKLLEAAKHFDGILSMIFDRLDSEFLEKKGKLQVLSNYGTGLDNIDVAYANKMGIAVYNLPDIVTESTADLAFAIFLSLLRKIPAACNHVKEGKWHAWDPQFFLGEELQGKTFGIVGFGRIGKAVARRALGFGLKIICYHHKQLDGLDEFQGKVKQVGWDELLASSNYISLHVPLTEKTKHLINLQAFQKMRKKPLLINVARGAVVHTADLVQALKEGLIRGCALDVTDPEPLTKDHPLCFSENCLIVPHIGTATIDCRYQMAKKAAENLLTHFSLESTHKLLMT